MGVCHREIPSLRPEEESQACEQSSELFRRASGVDEVPSYSVVPPASMRS